jgi:hypothetical protein
VARIQSRIAADPRLSTGLARVLDHQLAPSRLITPALALRAAATALITEPDRRALLREIGGLGREQLRRGRPSRHAHRAKTGPSPTTQPPTSTISR